MIILKLKWGLGNQMFQYAFGKFLTTKHQVVLKFNLNHLLNLRIKYKDKLPIFRD